jgi:uncharacterized protein
MADTKGVALVTGASSGIGLARAKGHALIVTSDDGSELEQVARELQADNLAEVAMVVADLADLAGPERLYESVRHGHRPPDFLVSNAGRGVYGDFARETDLEPYE